MPTSQDLAIRSAQLQDMTRVQELAVAAQMFTESEVGFLLQQYEAGERGEIQDGHWIVAERSGSAVGAAYYAPEPYADRMWNLYFVVVDPQQQGQGLGKVLLDYVEGTLRRRGESEARVLVIETSSTEQYAGTRAFYERLGYTREATIRQFYGPDDHKVVFWKSLTEASAD
ncbi:MAG: GNAT family N-acetyltransferase [Acidobacteriota bacterium]